MPSATTMVSSIATRQSDPSLHKDLPSSTPMTATSARVQAEEELPLKSAARMMVMVGLSKSSLQNSIDDEDTNSSTEANNSSNGKKKETKKNSNNSNSGVRDSNAAPDATLPMKNVPPSKGRQGSDGTHSTAMTVSSSTEHDDFSSLGESHLYGQPRREVEDDDDDDENWSNSGIYSVGKLYGRNHEQEQLHDLYDVIVEHSRQTKLALQQQQEPLSALREFVLISGAVGTGKTALAETLRTKVFQETGGYFCTGTFDPLGQQGAVAPLINAFAEFVDQVLDRGDEEIAVIQRRIRSMVPEEDLPVLHGILPSLAELLTSQADTTTTANVNTSKKHHECPGPSSQNMKVPCDNRAYSHIAVVKLMRAISRPERPVVLFFDDLQWAGSCTYDFLLPMVMDDLNDGLMYLATTRDDVERDSEISKFLRYIEDGGVNITNISVGNLELEDIQEMVNDNFLMPPDQLASLALFLEVQSGGNPFFLAMSIQTMQREPRILSYDNGTNTWTMNGQVADQYVCNCPVELIRKKLEAYPRDQQKVLMVTACLGSHATKTMIETALQESAEDSLQALLTKRKLTFDEKEQTYSIRHNAIQEAARNLIGKELQPAFHLEIGLRLMRHLETKELEDKLFCVVSQFREGIHLVQDQDTKYEIAALAVRVAQKTAITFSFDGSLIVLQLAHSLLGPNHWEEAYDLSLVIYNYLAEVEFSVADNPRVDELIEEVLEKAHNCSDKLRAYTTKVHVMGVRGEADKAIKIGVTILQHLGVNIPAKTNKINLSLAMRKIGRKIKSRSNESLKRSPLMTDEKLLTCMQVLNLLFLNTFLHRAEMFPFIVLKMMKLSLNDGFSAMTSVAFAGYGTLLCCFNRQQEGQLFGKLALDLVEQFGATSYQSRVMGLYYGCIQPSVRRWKDSLEKLKEGHRSGLATGDIEFAMYNASLHFSFMLDDGSYAVSQCLSFLNETLELTALYGHSHQLVLFRTTYDSLKTYADPDGDLSDHTAMDDGLKDALEHGNCFSIGLLYCFKGVNYFTTGRYQEGLKTMDARQSALPRMDGSVFEVYETVLDGLFSFGSARRETNPVTRKKLIQRGRKAMKTVQRLAMVNPDSFGGKSLLLEAEFAALSKKEMVAKQKYSQTIAIATGHNATFDVAMANQVAADHFIVDTNDPREGVEHLEAAKKAYVAWGAGAAATCMQQKIEELKEKRRFSILRERA